MQSHGRGRAEPAGGRRQRDRCPVERFRGGTPQQRGLATARIAAYETGTPGHRSYDESGSWTDDALLLDERYLLAHVRGRGLTVLTACAHAGVVNTCLDAVATHPDVPVDLVLGGFHLAGAAVEDRIAATVADLHDRVRAAAVAPAHCTGWRGRTALAAAFGEEGYSPSSVGIRYALSAADPPGQGAASG